MEEEINEAKPCLVQTAQGFTVSYKEKLLYSKYNPSKAILQSIQKLEILPQTVILCVSPVLPYGLKELNQKLPQDSVMLACEYDSKLYDFILQNNKKDFEELKNFSFLSREQLLDLGPLLLNMNKGFRRIIRLDFSAGAQFYSPLYDKVTENAANALMTFWANRVTLVKFGRKYSTNFFKNLAFSSKTEPIQKYFAAIEKPIIVFGAGESLQAGVEMLKEKTGGSRDFFILCADTALQPLLAQNIIPDGVFIEEAQNVICKSFIGAQKCGCHIFAGLSSLHSITRYFEPEQLSFFMTEFTQANFIKRFDEAGILPPKNKPFGSVGITAWYYANIFRKDSSIPIYTYGLDFSYSAGRTHTKGAMADNARFMTSNRIKNDANYAAAFCEPAFKKGAMFTTPILQRYADLMTALRQAQGPQTMSQGPQFQSGEPDAQSGGPDAYSGVPEPVEGLDKISLTLQQEAKALQELKSILTGDKKIASDKIEQTITELIQDKEYLYLHFPDGHKFQYTQSFLNRVRVEVDYFLKVIS